ncbi:MAG: hypothetical protein N2490_08325, partial [Ignavibacteria bacterium]|nr:hypothetical protein [Ignavibacteria bacterium]
MKNINIITITLIALLTLTGFALGQYNESFEGQFAPEGWSTKGWDKSGDRAKTGKFSALSKDNNLKKEENFLKINSMSINST